MAALGTGQLVVACAWFDDLCQQYVRQAMSAVSQSMECPCGITK